MKKQHEFYMKKVIELAKNGWGMTNPNPLVGCVIVKDDEIIAQGYHQKIGGNHAEVNAINDLIEKKLDARGATLYVNLEPCSHYGKTPPCANALLKLGLKRVVIGMKDPNPLVCGRGIKILEDAGIEVITGILEDECISLNEIFINHITTKKPFVILKSAMTLDGKICTHNSDSKWITCQKSREIVHKVRDRVSAVMVGINTVLTDNPMLNVRMVEQHGKESIKIIVDSTGKLPLECNLIKNIKNKDEVILATTSKLSVEKQEEYTKKGVLVIKAEDKNGRVDLKILMDKLHDLNIDSVLLEGGGTLNESALKSGIVDKVMFFISPKIVGGMDAKTPVEGIGASFVKDAINVNNIIVKMIEEDILIEGLIKKEGVK